jgi:soluble lytic murein transglycosylase-like protein
LLTKRTYIVPVLLAAIAFPAAATAASGVESTAPQIGLTYAKTVKIEVFRRPVEQLHQAIRIEVKKLRAEHRAKLQEQRRESFAHLPGGVSLATLNAIAACESGGNPTAVSAGGTYRGLYQFDYGTWASVGGKGDPAAASAAEQTYRAALLYSRSGSSPWPVCG